MLLAAFEDIHPGPVSDSPEMLCCFHPERSKKTPHEFSPMRYMAEINCTVLEKYILSVNGNQKLTHEEMMYIRIYCHGIVGLACEWIMGQIDATIEEIAGVYEQSVPEPLKKYLL